MSARKIIAVILIGYSSLTFSDSSGSCTETYGDGKFYGVAIYRYAGSGKDVDDDVRQVRCLYTHAGCKYGISNPCIPAKEVKFSTEAHYGKKCVGTGSPRDETHLSLTYKVYETNPQYTCSVKCSSFSYNSCH